MQKRTTTQTALAERALSDFTLGARSEFPAHAPTPGEYFDKFHRLDGVVYAELDDDDRKAYDDARDAYVRVCTALQRSHAKRENLERAHEAARAWSENEQRAGRSGAGFVPIEWMRMHGVRIVEAGAARTPRARETRARPQVRGRSSSSGRDPPSDDPDDEPPPLARRQGGRLGVRAYRDGSA